MMKIGITKIKVMSQLEAMTWAPLILSTDSSHITRPLKSTTSCIIAVIIKFLN